MKTESAPKRKSRMIESRVWVSAMWLSAMWVVSTLCACADEDDSPSSQEEACVDTAAAVGRAAQRCGQDYQANYDAFVVAAAGGDCANIKQVRDEASLRNTCIPSFATIACETLIAGQIDPTCQQQLLRRVELPVPLPGDFSPSMEGPASLGRLVGGFEPEL